MDKDTAGKLLATDVQAAVLDCCLDHPEWGTPEGARLHGVLLRCYAEHFEGTSHPEFRRAWELAGCPEEFGADVELAEMTLENAAVGRYLVPAEAYGPDEVLSGVVVGDFVVDVIARRFDPDLPFPLILPQRDWRKLMDSYEDAA